MQFSRPRSSGLIALKLEEGDTLIAAAITDGAKEVMLFSSAGKVIRFAESVVRIMGRNARGVRGMRLGRAAADLHADSGVRGADPHRLRARLRQAYPLSKFPRRGRGGQG